MTKLEEALKRIEALEREIQALRLMVNTHMPFLIAN